MLPQQSLCSAKRAPFFQASSTTTFCQSSGHASPFLCAWSNVNIFSVWTQYFLFPIPSCQFHLQRHRYFPLVMHPQIAFAFFFSQAKKTNIWVLHSHSVRKYFTTVFTNPFSTLSSQYSIFYTVYLLTKLYVLALQLWKSAFHLTALVPALKVIHAFLDDFPNLLCLDNASQHHGISKF